jgi:hypothetical protein
MTARVLLVLAGVLTLKAALIEQRGGAAWPTRNQMRLVRNVDIRRANLYWR